MSLQKWLDSGFLRTAKPVAKDIAEKYRIAERNLRAASLEGQPDDIAFRLAYEAVVVVAQALLLADGYRPATTCSHYYSIESLEYTLGESRDKLILLQAMVKKRHISQYEMIDTISPGELKAMLKEARRIQDLGTAILMAKHPELAEWISKG